MTTTTTRLTTQARAELRAAGISEADWARRWSGEPVWRGDVCGCSDDRCIGYHHDDEDDCECLPVMLLIDGSVEIQ